MSLEDLLERHFAIQLGIECDEHRPQSALGMWTQQMEPRAARDRRSRVTSIRSSVQAVLCHRGRELRRTHARQGFANRAADRQRRQASLKIAAVDAEVLRSESLDQGSAFIIEGPLIDQDLRQAFLFVESPGGTSMPRVPSDRSGQPVKRACRKEHFVPRRAEPSVKPQLDRHRSHAQAASAAPASRSQFAGESEHYRRIAGQGLTDLGSPYGYRPPRFFLDALPFAGVPAGSSGSTLLRVSRPVPWVYL